MNEYTYPQFAGDNDPMSQSRGVGGGGGGGGGGLYGGQSYFTGDRPTQQSGGGYTFQSQDDTRTQDSTHR
jgi:hypothetical protein